MELKMENFTGNMRKYVYETFFDLATVPPEIQVQVIDERIQHCIRAVAKIVTQEELLCSYPRDWWQAFKQRWFCKWMLRRWPVETEDVWAVHKYPDLAVPSPWGREIIHLEVKHVGNENRSDSDRPEDTPEMVGL